MAANEYFEQALNVIRTLAQTQTTVIKSAAEMIAGGIIGVKNGSDFANSGAMPIRHAIGRSASGVKLIIRKEEM